MKEQDLLDSISEIDEEVLERSEHNKLQSSKSNESKNNNGIKHRMPWKILIPIAASLVLTVGIIVLLVHFTGKENNTGKESTNSTSQNNPGTTSADPDTVLETASIENNASDEGFSLFKTYKVSAAEYPEMVKYPEFNDYFMEDGTFNNEAYNNAINEWSNSQRKQWKAEDPDALEAGRKSLQTFITKGMKYFLSEQDHENRVYSPINIYIALGMLAELTNGNTRQQILDVLEVENVEELRKQAKTIWNTTYFDDGAVKRVLASSVWMRDDLKYNKKTLDTLAENYYASSFSGDMGSDEYSAALQAWLNEQTDGILDEQVKDVKLNQRDIIALATTICFSAKWYREFKKEDTKQAVFHAATGDIKRDFMNRTEYTGIYCCGDKFGATLQYFGNNGGSMLYILPDEGISVYDLLEDEQVMSLIYDNYDNLEDKYLKINLSVPKFDIASDQDIADSMKKLGITDAFDETKADFSPLTDETKEIWLGSATHGARVIADEEGVKAAAFTVMELAGGDLPPEDEMDFVLDRPFMFVIEYGIGTPLFIGIVENP